MIPNQISDIWKIKSGINGGKYDEVINNLKKIGTFRN